MNSISVTSNDISSVIRNITIQDIRNVIKTYTKTEIRHCLNSIECFNDKCRTGADSKSRVADHSCCIYHVCDVKPVHVMLRLIMEMELQLDGDFAYMLDELGKILDALDFNINVDIYHYYIIREMSKMTSEMKVKNGKLSREAEMFIKRHFYRILASRVKITSKIEVSYLQELLNVHGDVFNSVLCYVERDKSYVEIKNPVIKFIYLCNFIWNDVGLRLLPLIKDISNDELRAVKNISLCAENEYNRLYEFPEFVRRGCVVKHVGKKYACHENISNVAPFLWLSRNTFDNWCGKCHNCTYNNFCYCPDVRKCEIPKWAYPCKSKLVIDFSDVTFDVE